MKKKILILTTCMLLAVSMLTGCAEEAVDYDSSTSYPKIRIHYNASYGRLAKQTIDIGDAFEYDSYDKVNTDDGCTVTIHFKKVKTDKKSQK